MTTDMGAVSMQPEGKVDDEDINILNLLVDRLEKLPIISKSF